MDRLVQSGVQRALDLNLCLQCWEQQFNPHQSSLLYTEIEPNISEGRAYQGCMFDLSQYTIIL